MANPIRPWESDFPKRQNTPSSPNAMCRPRDCGTRCKHPLKAFYGDGPCVPFRAWEVGRGKSYSYSSPKPRPYLSPLAWPGSRGRPSSEAEPSTAPLPLRCLFFWGCSWVREKRRPLSGPQHASQDVRECKDGFVSGLLTPWGASKKSPPNEGSGLRESKGVGFRLQALG